MSSYAKAANSEKKWRIKKRHRMRQSIACGRDGRDDLHEGEIAMCGIAGFALAGSLSDADRRLRAMGDSIRHRGPDGEGFALFSVGGNRFTVGFAHRRLAIIDLVTGEQPMVHRETGVTLIYNGEIYNFLDLRRELEGLGHQFRTQSDTEVLLNAYVAW